MLEGFDALETMVQPGPYAYGSEVTLADLVSGALPDAVQALTAEPDSWAAR